MNTEKELPVDVIAEIQANRKVTAIKLLRSHQGIGLKEAKEIVDAYMDAHPSNIRSSAQKSEGSFGRILILALGVGVIYAIYSYFT
jgi:ribosomal protein L7/L12